MEGVREGGRKGGVGDGCMSGWKAPLECNGSHLKHVFELSIRTADLWLVSRFDPPLVLPWFSPLLSCDHIGFLPGQMNFLDAQHSCPKSSIPSHCFYFILG